MSALVDTAWVLDHVLVSCCWWVTSCNCQLIQVGVLSDSQRWSLGKQLGFCPHVFIHSRSFGGLGSVNLRWLPMTRRCRETLGIRGWTATGEETDEPLPTRRIVLAMQTKAGWLVVFLVCYVHGRHVLGVDTTKDDMTWPKTYDFHAE